MLALVSWDGFCLEPAKPWVSQRVLAAGKEREQRGVSGDQGPPGWAKGES